MRTTQLVVVVFVALMLGFLTVTTLPNTRALNGVAASFQEEAISTLAQVGDQYQEALSRSQERRR